MSSEKAQARAVRLMLLGTISELSKPDQAAIAATAQKIRDAVAEGEGQTEGLGVLALGLVGAEMQEAGA
ncbi:hypothetical protein [Variovorax sp.]|jgi:hypothetical protein|uniref:hypothetical protein n=1 Tax=Variovorax sp. TaxID=1871043 RepID=UPI004037F6A9